MEYSKWLLTGIIFSFLIFWSAQISLPHKKSPGRLSLPAIIEKIQISAQECGTGRSAGAVVFPEYPVP
jgi:hypothetical protein